MLARPESSPRSYLRVPRQNPAAALIPKPSHSSELDTFADSRQRHLSRARVPDNPGLGHHDSQETKRGPGVCRSQGRSEGEEEEGEEELWLFLKDMEGNGADNDALWEGEGCLCFFSRKRWLGGLLSVFPQLPPPLEAQTIPPCLLDTCLALSPYFLSIRIHSIWFFVFPWFA